MRCVHFAWLQRCLSFIRQAQELEKVDNQLGNKNWFSIHSFKNLNGFLFVGGTEQNREGAGTKEQVITATFTSEFQVFILFLFSLTFHSFVVHYLQPWYKN